MPDSYVLSMSSQVAYGHVGNCAAVPALQALGHEVLAVPTVLLAHHPGHGVPTGRVMPSGEVADLLRGLEQVGALGKACALLTGYLGLAETATVATDAAARLRHHHPKALYLCDPVIGDNGKVYVRPGVEDAIRKLLLPLADVLTPNHFELERLAGCQVTTLDQAVRAARSLIALGPKVVVVTTLSHQQAQAGQIETLAVTAEQVWIASTPRLDQVPNGGGDLLAALLLGHLVLGNTLPDAFARAVSAVYQVLVASVGEPELRLVAQSRTLLAPPALALRTL